MSATNRGAERREADFYPTPARSVEVFMLELKSKAKHLIWGEPCSGDGVIPRASGISFTQWRAAEIRYGRDYLEDGLPGPGKVDAIITNPPFFLAQQFIELSLNEANFVAYLLRLNYLGSKKRKEWWQGKEPTHLFTLSERPSFTGKGTDATEYAWFVWDKIDLCIRKPGIYVI